jgi:hypothetical protein
LIRRLPQQPQENLPRPLRLRLRRKPNPLVEQRKRKLSLRNKRSYVNRMKRTVALVEVMAKAELKNRKLDANA